MPPVVLVTMDRRDPAPGHRPGPRVRPYRAEAWLTEAYVLAVRRAGGLPLLVPPGPAAVRPLLDLADAVVLTGGHFDIHPSLYGEDVEGRLDRVEPARTDLELALAAACLAEGVPILGVCGGMQALAVASGGRLIQDLQAPFAEHEQLTDPAQPWHTVRIEAPASRWLGTEVQANSTHHQAVASVGPELVLCGWTDDGVPEVLAARDERFVLGVQWHPELLGDLRPYEALVSAASRQPPRATRGGGSPSA